MQGEVQIGGAKNSALKLMVAALLGQGAFCLENVPHITDVCTMAEVLESLGARVLVSTPNVWKSKLMLFRAVRLSIWLSPCGLRYR